MPGWPMIAKSFTSTLQAVATVFLGVANALISLTRWCAAKQKNHGLPQLL